MHWTLYRKEKGTLSQRQISATYYCPNPVPTNPASAPKDTLSQGQSGFRTLNTLSQGKKLSSFRAQDTLSQGYIQLPRSRHFIARKKTHNLPVLTFCKKKQQVGRPSGETNYNY